MTSVQSLAVVAAVSREHGLVAWHICDRSINSDTFIEFLQKVTSVKAAKDSVIFMDNCRVHHSKKVNQHLADIGLRAIFNVPYSPQFNPIEKYWAMLKYRFKMLKLRALQQEAKINYRDLIQ